MVILNQVTPKPNKPLQAYKIETFVEKPNLTTAQEYLTNGSYLWNSGMFMFKASVYLQELEKFNPLILRMLESLSSKAK